MTIETATPVFRVSDYQRAKAFWTDALGFACVEEAGEPVTGFGIFRRDGARVFLVAWNGPEAAYDKWRAYFHVTDFEAHLAEVQGRTPLSSDPVLTEYGMREFEVTDPDGNVVCFGADP
ncbi:MAG: VOC family protein [Pseudomonadota bacterium]